jgi:dihydroflavonol-4-reductase
MTQTVFITGVSGYIGLHCAAEALKAGYRVKGSVRSRAKETEVRESLAAASIDTEHLEFVELDLNSDQGWDKAVEGCSFMLHVASPFTIANPKSDAEVIGPAVEGTLRVLRASQKASVERVVLTSSILSMMGTMKTGTFGPEDWTDVNDPQISTYTRSKTLAEKAAWDFIEQQSGEAPLELVVVNPGGVFGPPLGKNISGQTMQMVDQMLRGKMPMVPNAAFPMVDVRDVAQLHLQAMTKPEAKGQRFIAASEQPFGFARIAQVLKDEGYKGPSTRIAPSFLLRFLALFDREAKGTIGFLGMNPSSDNSKTRELFAWTPIPLEQSVVETAQKVSQISGVS